MEMRHGIDWARYNDMKIVALYKTFSGNEFVEASIQSIYRFCHKIVFVHSDTSWSGEKGNDVAPVVENWKKINDGQNRITNLYTSLNTQDAQYDYGFDYIKRNYPCNWILLIDTDEIWDDDELRKVLFRIYDDDLHNAVSIRLHTYIKSVFYKVHPPEWCKPTVFVRASESKIKGPRGINNGPKIHFDDVFAHHFTYVRRTEEAVMKKITTSFIGDGPGTHCVDMKDWIENKWNKLPFATNFHTTRTCETSWKSIKACLPQDLPEGVRVNEYIMSIFLPEGMLLDEDMKMLNKYSQNADVAVDLGTFLGKSAVILSLTAKKVYTVDMFEWIKTECLTDTMREYVDLQVVKDITRDKVAKSLNTWYKNIEIIQSVTYDAARLFENNSVDTLFIDADHGYWGVKTDFESWYSKVKVGGYILFHDYSSIWKDIPLFIDDLLTGKIGDYKVRFVDESGVTCVLKKEK